MNGTCPFQRIRNSLLWQAGGYVGRCPFMLGFFILVSGIHQLLGQRIQLTAPADTGHHPLPDAVVIFQSLEPGSHGQSRIGLTDASGSVRCPYLGKQVVQVNHLGFHKLTDTLEVEPEATVRLALRKSEVELAEQVITGQYSADYATNAVDRIRVVDRVRIETQAANNLRDLLTNELNIRLTQDNILGAGMEIQGLSGQNVKILVDGVPMVGRMNGNIDLQQINLNLVDRIEIVEGPMSAIYGTDALGGVIHLITKQPTKKLDVGVNGYYEHIGHFNADGRIGFAKGNHALQASGGRYFFDGWSPWRERTRYQLWKPREQYFGDLRYSLTIKNLKLRYQGNLFRERISNRGEPVVTPFTATARDEFYTTWRTTHNVYANVLLPKHLNLDLIASYNLFYRTREVFIRDMTTLLDRPTEDPRDEDTIRMHNVVLRGVLNRSKTDAVFNFQAGYDFNLDFAYGSNLTDGTKSIHDFSFFFTSEIKPVKRLTLRPSLRYGYNTNYRLPFIGSLSLRYEIVENLVFRASYARGFRTPTLKELYLYFVDINHNIQGNPNLKAEDSHNAQMALSWQKPAQNWFFRMEHAAFFNHVNNQIQLAIVNPDSLLYSYVNIGTFESVGYQFNSRFKFKGLTVDAGAAAVGRYNLAYSVDKSRERYIFSPEVRANVSYNFRKIGLTLAAFYKYNGRLQNFQVNSSGEVFQTFLADFHMLDVTATKTFWKQRISLTAGVKNALNVRQVAGFQPTAHSTGSVANLGTGVVGFASVRFNL